MALVNDLESENEKERELEKGDGGGRIGEKKNALWSCEVGLANLNIELRGCWSNDQLHSSYNIIKHPNYSGGSLWARTLSIFLALSLSLSLGRARKLDTGKIDGAAKLSHSPSLIRRNDEILFRNLLLSLFLPLSLCLFVFRALILFR